MLYMRRRNVQRHYRFGSVHTLWSWIVLCNHSRNDSDNLSCMSGQFKLSKYELSCCRLHVQRRLFWPRRWSMHRLFSWLPQKYDRLRSVHKLPGLLRRDVRALWHFYDVYLYQLHRRHMYAMCCHICPRQHQLRRLCLWSGIVRRKWCIISLINTI